MGARSLMTAGMFAVIQLGAWEFVSAQEPPPFGDEFGLGAEGIEEIEALPEFQVEVLVFAYNAFDPSEENFNRKPRPALLGSLQEVEEPEPVEAIDPFQRPFLPAGVPDLPEPALDSTEADDPAEPPTPGEAESEEPRSIAEQLIATLAVLEDEPESLDPIAPATPTDPALADFEGVDAQDPFSPDASNDGAGNEVSGETELLAEGPEEERFRFRILSAEELELDEAYAMLENLDAYTPLAHGGWVQEGLPEERAHPFHLSLLGALNPTGTVQLHLSRFLHVSVDLDYRSRPQRTTLPEFASYAAVLEEYSLPPRYTLRAQRRTRSGELHYFDHPAFGLLVIVRPQPEAPEETESTDELLSPPLGPAA